MVDGPQLSPGGATALVALPCVPQDVKFTVQIKEEICKWHLFTVSDGTYWITAIFACDFPRKLRYSLRPLQIVTITKAWFHKNWGYYSSYFGLLIRNIDILQSCLRRRWGYLTWRISRPYHWRSEGVGPQNWYVYLGRGLHLWR